jgi:hypothetical protein
MKNAIKKILMLTLLIGSISSVGVKIFAKIHENECRDKYDGEWCPLTFHCKLPK